ncbi:transcriptional regulator [Microbacterium sp. Gd 4-13]|uniref:LCP family protein n=1 Tax=Microbacterium sp. Gd 4-13 TaxID=2173179 RepID=UPI000D57CF55|nr:LCP family protein [Microbacterium sp. Gd 4-13]PVW05386.1 transcriptional regulator [Microbacterium sp. Gd 4-13]
MARRRKTVAQHARLGSPSLAAQLLTLVGVIVAVVLVAGAGTIGYTAYSLAASIEENSVDLDTEVAQPPSVGAYEGPFDVLIVGTDECEPALIDLFPGRCTGPDADGRLNDVNMLVHVSDAPRRVTVVSFPRDLQLAIPECTDDDGVVHAAVSKESLNAAYGKGGLNCVVNTVSALSGLSIPFAAKASFGNVIAITDAIGGVEVCIGEGGLRDPKNTGIDWPAGPRTVQGAEALQFLRVRSGVGDGSDLARIGNQQQYLSSLSRKLTGGVLSDPAAVLRLATAASENITPSSSLANPIRIMQLALAAKDVPTSDITFVQFPVFDDPSNTNHVIPDQQAAAELWDALAQNRPLELTGQLGANGGVVEAAPTETTPPSDATETTPPSDAPEPTDAATSAPSDESVALPGNVNGSKADQATCTA